MKTQHKFLQFIQTQHLFRKSDRILLAVSGGVDSMVMCELFLSAGFNIGIGHINYELRGEASFGDQELVRTYAEEKGVPFFTENYPTEKRAAEAKKSIQLLARELRYEWLEKIRKENDYHYIATAHHLNDSLETILYNWTKGTSIKGLMGVPVCNGFIIRPLLSLSRKEIEGYAADQKVPFREDASNQEDKYARNKIRLKVLPVLKDINPNLEETVGKNLPYLEDVNDLYYWAVFNILKKSWTGNEESSSVNFQVLEEFPAPATILYEWLSPFGFNSDQVAQIWGSRDGQAGSMFYSTTHQLLVDRETFILQKRIEKNKRHKTYILEKDVAFLQLKDARLRVEYPSSLPTNFTEDAHTVYVDSKTLIYPLTLRPWQTGDHFCPLGMNGQTKKIQDFFTDQKLPRTEKDKVWILEDGSGRICWIVGHRLDDRFKITPQTQSVIKLIYEP